MKKVLIPITNGSEELEAVAVIDILRRAGVKVVVASDDNIVTCSRGVKIIPDIMFDEIDDDEIYDAIILPGGVQGTDNLQFNEQLKDILTEHNKREVWLAAVCAAPKIFAFHKLAETGGDMTSHPSVKDRLANYNYLEDAVVVNKNIVTSRGAGTIFEFAFKLVEILAGKEKADEIKSAIVYKAE